MQRQNGTTLTTWNIYKQIQSTKCDSLMGFTLTSLHTQDTTLALTYPIHGEMYCHIDTSTIESIESEVENALKSKCIRHLTLPMEEVAPRTRQQRRQLSFGESIRTTISASTVCRSSCIRVSVCVCFCILCCANESNNEVKYLRKTYFIEK